MLALLFIKATNGVADAAQQMANKEDILFDMKLKNLTNLKYVAPLICRCSKQVKNTFFICGVAKYIIDNKDLTFPDDESFILHCKKWAPKVCHCLYGGLFKRIYG